MKSSSRATVRCSWYCKSVVFSASEAISSTCSGSPSRWTTRPRRSHGRAQAGTRSRSCLSTSTPADALLPSTTGANMRTDSEIKRNVEQELRWDADIDSTDIAVAVKDSVVTLTGFVRSYTQKWRAERDAK